MIVQIYGLTTVSDAEAVDALKPEHIGVVLDEGIQTWDSVDVETALAIRSTVRNARLVALSLSTDLDRVRATADLLQPEVVHLARAHQMDTDALGDIRSAIQRPLMLTVPVQDAEGLTTARRLAPFSDWLVLDTAHPETGTVGATGLVHNWEISAAIVVSVDRPCLLAGGLGADNVIQAIEKVRPAGVDSETRTSQISDRRRKDLDKVRAFIEIARAT